MSVKKAELFEQQRCNEIQNIIQECIRLNCTAKDGIYIMNILPHMAIQMFIKCGMTKDEFLECMEANYADLLQRMSNDG